MSLSEPISAPRGKAFSSKDIADLPDLEILDHGRSAGQQLRRWTGSVVAVLVLTDLAAILIGFGLAIPVAAFLRSVLGLDPVATMAYLVARDSELVLLVALTIGIFAFGGLYRRGAWELDELRKIVGGMALVGMFDATLQFALADHTSRLWAITAYPLVAVAVVSLRMIVRAHPAVRASMTTHVVLIGGGVTPDRLTGELRESRAAPVNLVASLPLAGLDPGNPLAIAGLMDETARRSGVPAERLQLVLAPGTDEIAAIEPVTKALNWARQPYSLILPFGGLARNGLDIKRVIGADMVMAEMRPAGQRAWTRIVKRVFDLVLTVLGLILLAPFLLAVVAALSLESGPVLFTQTRVGRGGRRFRCIKFRTMRPDAEARLAGLLASGPAARAEWARYQKLKDDPRVTPLGHFLRRTSLDELPQLWNVIKGEMSLVGPRPIIAPEVDGYESDKAYFHDPDFAYYKRCLPGLTGLWQVCGRNDTTHRERVRLDRWYARNWSFWLDLLIVFKTFRVVVGRDGSA